MIKRTVVFVMMIASLAACNMKEKEVAWQHQVDSLQTALTLQTEAMQTLQEVGILIDSIDASRDLLRSNIVEGLPHDSFVARLDEINEHVKATQLKIDDLERSARKTNANNKDLKNLIAKLKQDLKIKSDEIVMLTAEVNRYRTENESLNSTVSMQTAELSDKLEQLAAKQQEVSNLEDQVKEILAQANFDMAESYYLRAQALEEAANRTNFAPKKKKSTRKEALELYKLAALSGKAEAADKVKELEN